MYKLSFGLYADGKPRRRRNGFGYGQYLSPGRSIQRMRGGEGAQSHDRRAYGRTELTDPRRTVTSTVRVKGRKDCAVSVKTASPIPKGKIMECMKALKETEAIPPVAVGDVVLENVAGTGVAVVATRNVG